MKMMHQKLRQCFKRCQTFTVHVRDYDLKMQNTGSFNQQLQIFLRIHMYVPKKYPYVNRHCMCSESRDDMMFTLQHLTNMYIFFLFKKITKCCNHITFIRKIVFSLVVKHMRNSSSPMARVLTLQIQSHRRTGRAVTLSSLHCLRTFR